LYAHRAIVRCQANLVWAQHAKHGRHRGVIVIAAARKRDRLGSREAAVFETALVNMDTNHLTEHDMAVGRPAVEIAQLQNIKHFALERRPRCGDARRPHQPARRGGEFGQLELVDLVRHARGALVHRLGERGGC